MRNKFRVRRGMMSLTETAICIVIFAVMMSCLLTMVNISGTWTARAKQTAAESQDISAFVETVREDVKSSYNITLSDGVLQLVQSSGSVLYSYNGTEKTITRGASDILKNVEECTIVPKNGEYVEFSLRLSNGDAISFIARR